MGSNPTGDILKIHSTKLCVAGALKNSLSVLEYKNGLVWLLAEFIDVRRGHITRGPNAAVEKTCEDSHHARAAIAQLAARRSHNPKVVSSILTRRILGMIPNSRSCGLRESHSERKSSLQRQNMTLA